MNTHFAIPKKLTFCCQEADQQANICLGWMQSRGYETVQLTNGQSAPIGSIALYTGYNEQWPSHCLRIAAHRLYPGRPQWAVTTPFLVAIKPNSRGDMEKAMEFLAEDYRRWFLGDAGVMLPWETRNGPHSSYTELVESWLDMVGETVGEEVLRQILESQKSVDKYDGYGGDVVFRKLGDSGRVVLEPAGLPEGLSGNSVYKALTGLKGPVVSYGTSDLANLFELLQAVVLGHKLGLPVVFETYPGSHNVGWWVRNFLNPSLDLIGAKIWPTSLGMEPTDKYTAVLRRDALPEFIKSAKLANIQGRLEEWADRPLWVIYQDAMRACVDVILRSVGVQVDFRFTTTEDICRESGLWEITARDLANTVELVAGHPVVAFNTPTRQLMTTDDVSYRTVAELHAEGSWLGGAALYHTIFNLGRFGGVVVMVKDSTMGRVNLMARKFFVETSDLLLAPVGLFRLTAEGENEDWSIDPLVLLSLFESWGPEKTVEVSHQIWDAMATEIPLTRAHIGRKTVAKISQKGVQVRVSER